MFGKALGQAFPQIISKKDKRNKICKKLEYSQLAKYYANIIFLVTLTRL